MKLYNYLIGDEATIMCSEGFQMVANHSMEERLKAVQDVRVICSSDGMWERPFQYRCMDPDLLAKVIRYIQYYEYYSYTYL